MGKRKLELNPEEISSNFKRNKFDHANGIIELLIKIESDKSKVIRDCITALGEITVKVIKEGDTAKSAKVKPDDLKDAADKYKDWIQLRFLDIIKKFIKLLHHPKVSVSSHALDALLNVVRLQSREEEYFPWFTYMNLLGALLTHKMDCRKLIAKMKEPLQHQDLVYYTFRIVSKLVTRRGSNSSKVYVTNLISLLVLLKVPPKKKPTTPSPLWCTRREDDDKEEVEEADLPSARKKDLSKKAQKKKEKAGSKKAQQKSKYEEVMNQPLPGEDIPSKEDNEDMDEDGNGAYHRDESDYDDVGEAGEVQRKLDAEEFKAGEKMKKKRRQNRMADDDQQQDDHTPEKPQEQIIKMPAYKFVPEKDRLLPAWLFSGNANGTKEGDNDELCNAEQQDDEDSEEDKGPLFKYRYKLACQFVSNIWDKVMSFTLTEELYKRCLVFIPEQVMDHLNEPVKLTDFFIGSYNCGGGVSLMAMHGVFQLMNKHNIKYPDFYSKVYGMLVPSVFNARYKGRFFLLLNVFLSSSHLPEYIAAAFVKRLARLLHCAPDTSTLLVVKVIGNLLSRFPSLVILYDNESKLVQQTASLTDDGGEDRYIVASSDLQQCRATDTSLWEVASLSMRAVEKLYKACHYIRRAEAPEEVETHPHLETEYDEIDPSTEADADNQIKKASITFRNFTAAFFVEEKTGRVMDANTDWEEEDL